MTRTETAMAERSARVGRIVGVAPTADDRTVGRWESGTGTFEGQTTAVTTVPALVHPQR